MAVASMHLLSDSLVLLLTEPFGTFFKIILAIYAALTLVKHGSNNYWLMHYASRFSDNIEIGLYIFSLQTKVLPCIMKCVHAFTTDSPFMVLPRDVGS